MIGITGVIFAGYEDMRKNDKFKKELRNNINK